MQLYLEGMKLIIGREKADERITYLLTKIADFKKQTQDFKMFIYAPDSGFNSNQF